MTDEVYYKAREIYDKLYKTKYELGAFKRLINKNGYVELIPELGNDHFGISNFVSDYIKRKNVATEIIKIMEEEIQKLQKEYEEL